MKYLNLIDVQNFNLLQNFLFDLTDLGIKAWEHSSLLINSLD